MFNSSAIRYNRLVIIYIFTLIYRLEVAFACKCIVAGCIYIFTFKTGNRRAVLDSFTSMRAGILICLIYYPLFLGGILNEDGYFPFSGFIFIVDKYPIVIAVQTSNTHILVPSLNVFGMYIPLKVEKLYKNF